MNRNKPFEIEFPNGKTARAVQVERQGEIIGALRDLGLDTPCDVIVVVGGAAGLGTHSLYELYHLLLVALVPLAQSLGATVVDGATDSGVIQLMGRARAEIGGTFPLIGVAAIGTVSLRASVPAPQEAWPLEPNHSHFILVPGEKWGDEVPWISHTATLLAQHSASVTVLINGGQVTWHDVEQSVKDKRPVIVVAGSGRTADTLAAAVRGESSNDRANALVDSGFLRVIDLADNPRELVIAIKESLSEGVKND